MNPYDKYQQQMVSTMTQSEMLLKLYDETIKQIDIARNSIAQGKIDVMDKAISKAERIIRYLRGTLDFRYPVSNNLAQLYDFFNTQLVMASVKRDVKPIDDIRPLVVELRDTFEEASKVARNNRTGTPMGSVV